MDIDLYLNHSLTLIEFEFPTDHYLIYNQDDDRQALKNIINENKFRHELSRSGWNVDCQHQGKIKFYREIENVITQKSKLKKQSIHRSELNASLKRSSHKPPIFSQLK